MCVKLWQKNTGAGVSLLIKFQAGAVQLYSSETLALVLSFEYCLVSQSIYLQIICKKLLLLFFVKFHFFLCEQLQYNFFLLLKFLFLFSSKKLQHKCYNQKTYKSFLFNKHKIKHLKVKIKAQKKRQKAIIIKLKIKNKIKVIIIILMKKII